LHEVPALPVIDPSPELGVIHVSPTVPGEHTSRNCGFGDGGFVSWCRSDNRNGFSSHPAFCCDCSWLIFDKSSNHQPIILLNLFSATAGLPSACNREPCEVIDDLLMPALWAGQTFTVLPCSCILVDVHQNRPPRMARSFLSSKPRTSRYTASPSPGSEPSCWMHSMR